MIGSTIGKYRIVDKLGRGGMGTVYRAIDETLDREVAVKVLNSDVDDATLMARFRAEAKTVARLNHPQIATIYEIYRSDTDVLMVMELIRGETLDRLSTRIGPLPPVQAASYVVQVLGALAHAHRAGIVHRDLKPANVMVTEEGTIKVMDFGIARVLGAEHLTMDGMLMGTPAYMAPEQVMGQDVDGRTDLYSVGVVFYRLLTGCLPFQADTPIAMVRKQLDDPPTPARSYRADLPEWCETILERALAKEPVDRFQTAEEFRSALVSAIGQSNAPAGMSGTEYMTAPFAAPAIAVRPAPIPAAPTPSHGLMPAELAALALAPTVLGEVTPVPKTAAGQAALPAAHTASSAAMQEGAPSVSLAIAATLGTPKPSSPRQSAGAGSRRGLYATAAVVGVVLLAGVLVRTALRGTPSAGPVDTTSPAAAVSVSEPAAAQPGDTGSAAETTPATEPATLPLTPDVAPAADGSSGRASSPGTQASGARRSPTVARGSTPPAGAGEPAVAPLESRPFTPTATVDTAVAAPAAAALPPLVFSAQTVLVDGGKPRQRDTTVQVANGAVTIAGKDTKVVTTVPLGSVVGFTVPNSKQPMWNSPNGPAEIVHLDGGAFGIFKGDQHWVSLRTDNLSLVWRVREQDSQRIVAGIEERLGKKVERISEPK